MKSLLVISLLAVLNAAFAGTITVDIPAGHNSVVLSHTVHHSGCGSTTNYLSVVKTQDKYVVGADIGLKHSKSIFKNLMPKILPPRRTCMAYVSTTTVAHFAHMDNRAETVLVEVPDHLEEDLKVEIKKMNVVY